MVKSVAVCILVVVLLTGVALLGLLAVCAAMRSSQKNNIELMPGRETKGGDPHTRSDLWACPRKRVQE